MTAMLQGGPFLAPVAGHRFTVKQYHKMIANGVFAEDDRVELLEGYFTWWRRWLTIPFAAGRFKWSWRR